MNKNKIKITLTAPVNEESAEALKVIKAALPLVIDEFQKVGMNLSSVEIFAFGLALLESELSNMKIKAYRRKKEKEGGRFDA